MQIYTPLKSDFIRYKKQFDKDRFANHNGIYLEEASPGYATASMEISELHLNSVGVLHGGALFALADFAFAVASNAHGRIALAIEAEISFFTAIDSGVLTAVAKEANLNNRLGTYLVDIYNETNDLIAHFKGTVYRKSQILDFG
jgi:acyl-CoA thioesterase